MPPLNDVDVFANDLGPVSYTHLDVYKRQLTPTGLALATAAPQPAPVVVQPATIVYGSQTGNAKRAAEVLHAQLEAAGLPSRLLRADAFATRELANESLLFLCLLYTSRCV